MLGMSLSLPTQRSGSAAPVATSINPSTGVVIGGEAFTITGTNFTGVTSVLIGGNPATSVNVVNSTTISGITPSGAGTV
ncbi:IPT/TIG domain-containing protein, partial [Propionibacterium freudenreichii]|uniref:IPT/TIG domain-containing protein n=1 Tax=Propionibacterium freudenreichii TaxID=1744 RepID=UPI003854EDC3